MAVLKFKADDVARIVRHTLQATSFKSSYGDKEDNKPAFWLVGDQGVYLMSNADPGDWLDETKKKLHVAYAQGCDPTTDAFDVWYDNKRDWFGGDDGCDVLPWIKPVGQQLLSRPKFIRLSLTKKGIKLLDPLMR